MLASYGKLSNLKSGKSWKRCRTSGDPHPPNQVGTKTELTRDVYWPSVENATRWMRVGLVWGVTMEGSI